MTEPWYTPLIVGEQRINPETGRVHDWAAVGSPTAIEEAREAHDAGTADTFLVREGSRIVMCCKPRRFQDPDRRPYFTLRRPANNAAE
jgi:hypothetical protein